MSLDERISSERRTKGEAFKDVTGHGHARDVGPFVRSEYFRLLPWVYLSPLVLVAPIGLKASDAGKIARDCNIRKFFSDFLGLSAIACHDCP